MTAWPCSECPKSFTRKGDLSRHSLLHAGYRPHGCSECGKSFAQHSGLKTHMNVHTRVKPFQCGTGSCQAAFGDPSSRARHRKETHSPVGVYQCPDSRCKSSIKRRSAFTAHLRKHGMKYAGVNIQDFYSSDPSPRSSTSHTAIPQAEYIVDFAIPDVTTYETQPAYPSYTPDDMLAAYPHDYSNDLRLQIMTGELFTFDSRSSSLSPPSLTSSSSSPSTSPSPSPLNFQDEHSHVNIHEANAPHDPAMSGAYPALSPVSQLMFALEDFEYNKQPIDWDQL
ncbi:hypothetical protein C8R44DRAFT_666139 [Mycena epipterygia]|nr:hypothetical protein C8R44DRAFT_666139 [Mycena epipterygia]